MVSKQLTNSGGERLAPYIDSFQQRLQAHRPADDEALRYVALHLDQRFQGLALLDPFGDDLALERMGKPDRLLDHQAVAPVVAQAFDEALIDLDLGRGDLLQIIEGR